MERTARCELHPKGEAGRVYSLEYALGSFVMIGRVRCGVVLRILQGVAKGGVGCGSTHR